MKTAVLTSLLATVAAGLSFHKRTISYDGYQVLRVKTLSQLATVQEKLAAIPHEQWNHDVETHIDIVISPEQVEAVESLGLDYRILHKDLGQSIAAESVSKTNYKRDVDDLSWYDSYHPYADHVQYLTDLQKSFPNNSELITSGRSYENRSIQGIHLWGDDGPGKPAVLYHATVHAREWIAAPVVEYITLQLINAHKNATNSSESVLNQYDFHIFPVVNPDGFVYSQESDRLWRKTRTPPPPGQTCFGTDINRNWEYGWDANPFGHSTNSCAQAYRGQKPSDTVENQGLDAYVRKLRDTSTIKLYIDWHSYGQYILSPFGSKEEWYAPELGKWTKTASLLSEVIRDSSDRRTTFTFGPSGATLYTTTGAAPDHVYAIGGADFSYTIELPDTGDYGFVLPPERILGAAEEQWAGQQVLYALLDEVFFDGVGIA
ncbi:Metallocarboxypeptidase A-like protein-like protein 2 [Colletotrichum chlorophyti]|uniref:Metallocarboxypeptidase A-like protein-like protein 2 n=1 Tax=Colletotrichum chlorophyti TaxID=708187 RepID=A0A1Q8RQC6_9PEZI|nr:Metallocarboxypeptidase A-like protein-like protein 2 [Colletotrichum chlorophyti]